MKIFVHSLDDRGILKNKRRASFYFSSPETIFSSFNPVQSFSLYCCVICCLLFCKVHSFSLSLSFIDFFCFFASVILCKLIWCGCCLRLVLLTETISLGEVPRVALSGCLQLSVKLINTYPKTWNLTHTCPQILAPHVCALRFTFAMYWILKLHKELIWA